MGRSRRIQEMFEIKLTGIKNRLKLRSDKEGRIKNETPTVMTWTTGYMIVPLTKVEKKGQV